MLKEIVHTSLVVNDYDEAINFYVNKLGFILVEDSKLSEEKRWVLVAANINSKHKLLLAKASTIEQRNVVGLQTGGRVFLFLETDNFEDDYIRLKMNGIEFVRERQSFEYGEVAVFIDLYGNLWDLIEYKNTQ